MDISDWIALGELTIGVIGIIIGIIGGKELHEANKIKVQFGDLNAKVDKIVVNNSQVAGTINNNGLGVKDTEHIASKIVDEKTKNKPDIYYGKESPKDLKTGDVFLQKLDNK